jgi:hypothetical protein
MGDAVIPFGFVWPITLLALLAVLAGDILLGLLALRRPA